MVENKKQQYSIKSHDSYKKSRLKIKNLAGIKNNKHDVGLMLFYMLSLVREKLCFYKIC